MWQTINETQLHKVTAFVTRGLPEPRDLLVFEHPTAGLQLPAGTVEAGETPRDAVLREVKEKTGLQQIAIISALGVRRLELADDEAYMASAALLQTMPDESSTLVSASILKRGMRVRVLEREQLFVRVTHEEGVMRDDGYVVTKRHTGWVPQHAITRHVERHFYHLIAGDETADEWYVRGEPDLMFVLLWRPLRAEIALVSPQAGWLHDYYHRLMKV
jgi:ADP-ribose pyrophosphatase YjhB (NUDIX family)